MSLKPDQSGMVEVLSQALRESQGRATRLEIELQSAVAVRTTPFHTRKSLSSFCFLFFRSPKTSKNRTCVCRKMWWSFQALSTNRSRIVKCQSDEISRLEENNAELRVCRVLWMLTSCHLNLSTDNNLNSRWYTLASTSLRTHNLGTRIRKLKRFRKV